MFALLGNYYIHIDRLARRVRDTPLRNTPLRNAQLRNAPLRNGHRLRNGATRGNIC